MLTLLFICLAGSFVSVGIQRAVFVLQYNDITLSNNALFKIYLKIFVYSWYGVGLNIGAIISSLHSIENTLDDLTIKSDVNAKDIVDKLKNSKR
jgi:hypothetical protein